MHELTNLNKHLDERAGEAFEAKTVSTILTFYGLAGCKAALLSASRRDTGRARLTLYQFHACFPSFPVYLYSKIITKLRDDHTVAALMQNFQGMRIYDHYCKVREDQLPADCTGKEFGLVLKWPYMKHPAVLHNLGVSTERGSMFAFRAKSETFCLEPLPSLLRGLGWQPGDD